MFKRSIILVASIVALAACTTNVDPEGETQDPAPSAATAETPEAEEENVGQVSSALSTCHAGEVGDSRWVSTGTCCGSSFKTARQNLQRCDGRYWRSTVTYRCSTTKGCAV